MKLVGELKDRVDKAKTIEKKKKVVQDVGVELTDEEMEQVSGGKPVILFMAKFFSSLMKKPTT